MNKEEFYERFWDRDNIFGFDDVWAWIEQQIKQARIDELERIHKSSETPLLKYVNKRLEKLNK